MSARRVDQGGVLGRRRRFILEVASACIAAIAVAVVMVSVGVDRTIAALAAGAIGGGLVALFRVVAVFHDAPHHGELDR